MTTRKPSIPPPGTGPLLRAVFITLALLFIVFITAFSYFNHLNTRLSEVIAEQSRMTRVNAALNRSLIDLELDIKVLMADIIADRKQEMNKSWPQLLEDFNQNIQRAAANIPGGQTALVRVLTDYRQLLILVKNDYGHLTRQKKRLQQMEGQYIDLLNKMKTAAGSLLMREAEGGHNRETSQQTYAMASFCLKELYHAQTIVKTAMAALIPAALLGNEAASSDIPDSLQTSALGHLEVLKMSLHTIISASPSLGDRAKELLRLLPAYEEAIQNLARQMKTIKVDQQAFWDQSRSVMMVSARIDRVVNNSLLNIRRVMNSNKDQANAAIWFISIFTLLILTCGFLLTRRLGRQLVASTTEAIKAREEQLGVNIRLQEEITERQQAQDALAKNRDELELRVVERTSDLAAANEMLQAEVEERSAVQEALYEEKELLTVTLHSIGDAVITTDIKGRIVIMNPVAEELTGWSWTDAVGRPLDEVFKIINEKSGKPYPNPVDRVLALGKIVILANHTALIAKDGRRRIIDDSGAPIIENGNMQGVVLVFRDITDKQRLENELVRSQKLESVGVLAGGIAHDFNNILTAILGTINMAREREAVKADDTLSSLLATSEQAVFRATSLTRQLLTFAKGGSPVKKMASLPETIKESTDFILRGSAIKANYLIPANLWPVEIDTGQISQVIHNLIVNAQNAMPEGGTINIKCRNFEHDGTTVPGLIDGPFIKTMVADNGSGIGPEIIDRIFDPYFTSKVEGNGLGLAVCHSIIKKHNGYITVESTPGQGTAFIFYLPATPDKPVAPSEEVRSPSDDSNKSGRIIIMDDEAIILELAAGMLSMAGFEVETTLNGEQAVALYKHGQANGRAADVLIMDLTVPGAMGGRDAAIEILRLNPAARIIVSSGYSNDPVMADYHDYGFCAAIAKPYRQQDLCEAVRKVMRS
ncbi:ATP-binding protein [Desulfobacterota bacterium M19]